MKDSNRLVVTRHTTLERLSHYAIIASLSGLAVSGFAIYLGMPWLEYSDAFAVHIISAAAFVAISLIVVPYSAISDGRLTEYWFWLSDARRLWAALSSFFTGGEYPRYTVYDERKKRFRNRLHPAGKLLLYSHYAALLVAAPTGLVLYSTDVSLAGVNVSGVILKVLDFAAPALTLSGLGLARLLHIAAAYWFVIEAVLHVGMVLHPKKFQHVKSIFVDGKENLMADPTAEILNALEE
jgi:cytochrome b subunit of formate dehydrogenase